MKNYSIFMGYSNIPSLHGTEIQWAISSDLGKKGNHFWRAPSCTCNT